jgi:hypothetical protein
MINLRRIVSQVLQWETLPEELPKLHANAVFVHDPVPLD